MGITAGSREVLGRNACDKRYPYPILLILIIIIIIIIMCCGYSVVTIYGAYITESNNVSTMNSNNRIAATLYSLGT